MNSKTLLNLILAGATCGANAGELVPVEQVTVHGYRTNLLGSSIAASEGLVTGAEIARRPLARTGEILEFVPGMVVTQHSGLGKANQYFLRGFNLDHGTDFATSVDGMPVNMRSHGHGQGYTDLNFVIPELVESIQYWKGPYYSQVGDFSGAGAAAFSLKNSLSKPQLSLSLGDYGYRRLFAGDSFATESGHWLVGLEALAFDGPWTQVDEDVQKGNLVGRYSGTLAGGDFSLTAMGYRNRWNSADQIPERVIGETGRLGSLDTGVGGESDRASLSGNWSTAQWRVSGYVIDSSLTLFSNFTYFLGDPVRGDQFEQRDDRQVFGGDLARKWNASVLGNPVTYQAGLEWRYDAIDEVGLYNTQARQRTGRVRVDSIDEGSLSLFVQGDMEFSTDLRAHLGVRQEYLEADVHSDLGQNSGRADDGMTNLKAGLAYNLSEAMEAYLNVGQGFHSNDARGATITLDPLTGEPSEAVDLLARSEGAELGLKLFDRQRYNLSLSLWQLHQDSELLFVGDAGNTEASRASVRSGVEFAGYLWFASAWSLDTELAWTRSRFSENRAEEGKYVDGSVPFVGSLGITYGRSQPGIESSLRWRYFGARKLDSFGRSGSPTSVVNLGLGYHWQQVRLGLEVFNLLDSKDNDIEYWYASRLGGEDEAGVEDLHFHPIEPRSLRLQLDYHF